MSSSSICSFGTYNILNPYHAVKWQTKDGLNDEAMFQPAQNLKKAAESLAWMQYSNWEERKNQVAINIMHASIICLQEVARGTLDDLEEVNSSYETALLACHHASTPFGKHGTAIVYDRYRAELLESHEVKFEGCECTRSAVCATFKIQDKIIRVMSIHLKGYNPNEENVEKKETSKKIGLDELKTYVADAETDSESLDGIVIAGDFNEDPSEKISSFYRAGYLEKKGYISDKNITATEPGTGRRIDWIYYKPIKTKKSSTTLSSLELEKDQIQSSDHLMTGTEIEWV